MSLNFATLWVVATPLGNPGDLSPRARETLSSVDAVLTEDTRRSGLLFSRCSIAARGFVSFHEHNEAERLPAVLDALRSGKSFALISDAGTPLISDPGYRLVRACREAGIAVSPIPGPSAPLTALCASGLPPHPFAFLGFPPRKEKELDKFFAPFENMGLTLIFFERKDRLAATLKAAHRALGKREGCIARELTKTHEEFIPFTLGSLLPFTELLGEITVLIGPADKKARAPEREVLAYLAIHALPGEKPKETAWSAAKFFPGWSAKEIYALLLRRPA